MSKLKCLIIAAGRGSRLKQECDCKPLYPLAGIPLIERSIRSAMEAGADDFYVVVGYKADEVSSFLSVLASRLGINITTIYNEEWASRENGFSVLKAQRYLGEPFLLLMSDHLFAPSIASAVVSCGVCKDEIALAVDRDIDNPNIDINDVTKVNVCSGKVKAIGKDLIEYNGFDTGVFYCFPAIFSALHKAVSLSDSSLSAAVKLMADNAKVKAVDVSGSFWIDVDDSNSVRKAVSGLLINCAGKGNDGPVSKWLNRPLSRRISSILINYPVTPNHISVFSFAISVIAALLFMLNGYISLLIGGILAQFASIVDGCDGEIARIKFMRSCYGGWLDAVLDRYADALLLFGLMWHEWKRSGMEIVLLVGFAAVIGSFMLSYTADKYDGLMRDKFSPSVSGLRLGRDVRVFLIFLAALFNKSYWALIIIAVIMNLETVRRMIVCRK